MTVSRQNLFDCPARLSGGLNNDIGVIDGVDDNRLVGFRIADNEAIGL
jgi:hypothetical protein